MRKLWILGLCLAATPVLAQQGPPPGVQLLRQRVMEQFLATYRNQAGLTPEQDRRFTEVFRRSLDQRRDNPDSLTKLLDGVIAQRAAMVEQTRAEQREYVPFLSPVQRAQLALMWERLQQQVEGIVRRRMEMQGRPGRMPPDTMPFPDLDTIPR
ncbi:MAG: hypothetical protein HYT81_09935 [Gemmatimonadetes bacterium]|nr:hypothetical protein [Gemmatimonadota bacterium]